jgi:hypothetical protein
LKAVRKARFMTAGTRLRITRNTIALNVIDGKRIVVMIPAEAIISVLADFNGADRLVNVLWEDRPVEMFAIDLTARGNKVRTRSAWA